MTVTLDVCIINSSTNSVTKRIPTTSWQQARTIERKEVLKLDQTKYHTEIRKGLTNAVQ